MSPKTRVPRNTKRAAVLAARVEDAMTRPAFLDARPVAPDDVENDITEARVRTARAAGGRVLADGQVALSST